VLIYHIRVSLVQQTEVGAEEDKLSGAGVAEAEGTEAEVTGECNDITFW